MRQQFHHGGHRRHIGSRARRLPSVGKQSRCRLAQAAIPGRRQHARRPRQSPGALPARERDRGRSASGAGRAVPAGDDSRLCRFEQRLGRGRNHWRNPVGDEPRRVCARPLQADRLGQGGQCAERRRGHRQPSARAPARRADLPQSRRHRDADRVPGRAARSRNADDRRAPEVAGERHRLHLPVVVHRQPRDAPGSPRGGARRSQDRFRHWRSN